MSKCIWVVAGGEFCADHLNELSREKNDLLVGVDRGIAHCLEAGLVPDVILGDFDSIDANLLDDARLAQSRRYDYPARKNYSDLELALVWASDVEADRVVMAGISGGRSDHHLFNWMLPLQQRWSFALELVDASTHAHLVSPRYSLNASSWSGQTISLVPMPTATGVMTSGLEYPLKDAQLLPGSTLGLSNVATEDSIQVSVTNGQLLVFRNKVDTLQEP